MSTTENSRIVRLLLEELIPSRAIAEAASLVAEGFVDHDPFPGAPTGRAGIAYTIEALHRTHGDLALVVDALLAVGDMVAVRWTTRGRDLTGFGRGAPTRSLFVQEGMAWFRLRRGLIEERWAAIDRLRVLEALRLVPPHRDGASNA